MPTATDMAFINGVPLQAVVATTPTPTLYWDDNSGNKSSVNILSYNLFPATSTVYLDDIAITYNPYGDIYAYITCRVLLPTNTTEIHLLTFQWSTITNSFSKAPLPTYQDTRPTTADAFDAVMIDADYNDNPSPYVPQGGNLAFTYSKNGDTYVSYGTVNYTDGSLTGFVNGQFIMSGKKPDIAMSWYWGPLTNFQTTSNFYIGTINGNSINLKDKLSIVNTNLYTTTNTIRSFSLIDAIWGVAIAINELDIASKKSFVKLLHNDPGYTTQIANVNFELEQNCVNNTNFKLTRFPKVNMYSFDHHGRFKFDIVWQQVFCNGSDFCTVQAVSKRYSQIGRNSNIVAENNNQFIYLSTDLTKNSFYPGINKKDYFSTYTNRKVVYSFNLMDKISSANGLVAYKNTASHNFSIFSSGIDDILKIGNKVMQKQRF